MIQLGRSDLHVSRLGFGCWQLGGHGWQDIDQQEIIKAIDTALDSGINFFDTADIYGLGASETLLGKVLGNRGIVATKFGVREKEGATYFDNSRQWLFEAVEASLKRLGRETIDLYQLHWPDQKRPLEDTLADLETLRTQGKIRWYGLSNIDPTTLKTLPEGLATFTLEYSLLQRTWERAIAATRTLSFLAWGSLAQGLLSGKYTRNHRFADTDIRSRPTSLFAPKHWDIYEPILEKLSATAKAHNRSMAQTALRWVLDTQPHSVVLTGIKNVGQLQDNLGALNWSLPASECEQF